jgi:uncharacterized cupin superfamily protein
MDKLITVTPAANVTEEYKTTAQDDWTTWDSKTRKTFPYNYQTEERVYVVSGSATLTPMDGSKEILIGPGDAVTFHVGFHCKWLITKRMKKFYAIFGSEEDNAAAASITCDECQTDCFEESYFVKDGELDICTSCYGKNKDKYKKVEHQKGGEKVVVAEKVVKVKEPKKKKLKTKQ